MRGASRMLICVEDLGMIPKCVQVCFWLCAIFPPSPLKLKDMTNQSLPRACLMTWRLLGCGYKGKFKLVCIKLVFIFNSFQRMPADPATEFGECSEYPYLSVCTPSTHDTSPVRGWWEESADQTQRYFTNILKEKVRWAFGLPHLTTYLPNQIGICSQESHNRTRHKGVKSTLERGEHFCNLCYSGRVLDPFPLI